MDCSFSPALRLAPEQLAIVERADRLAQQRFAPRAARHDAEAAFPAENFADLQAHGLLAMTVPLAYGGLAVDRLTELLVLRVVARACGSTALTFAMHSRIVKFIAALGTAEQRARYLPPVAEQGHLYASLTSEPRQSFRGDSTFQMGTELRPLPDGSYRLSGEKHFCSIGDRASGGLFLSGKLAGRRARPRASSRRSCRSRRPGSSGAAAGTRSACGPPTAARSASRRCRSSPSSSSANPASC
jgi:alkylation response protein AidB-like acyl-CoA dehydrogenase